MIIILLLLLLLLKCCAINLFSLSKQILYNENSFQKCMHNVCENCLKHWSNWFEY